MPAQRTLLANLLALLALLLPGMGCTTLLAPPMTSVAAVDPASSPEWATDMARFAREDVAAPPPRKPVVFTGSSSVRMWDSLASDFPGLPVLNRGFGGSQLRDAVWYADQVAVRYRPARILIYAGDNDLDADRTPAQVRSDFRAFVARVRRDLPRVPIAFIAIKPSPSRAHLLDRQREANDLVAQDAMTMAGVDYIDVFTPMLGADGQPRADLFLEDRLHLNRAGYALWREVIGTYLRTHEDWMGLRRCAATSGRATGLEHAPRGPTLACPPPLRRG